MDEGARPQPERLLRPAEVAALLRVDPDTVGRWAANGLIPSIRTPGGRRRYRESDIMALFEEPYDAPRRTRGSYTEQSIEKSHHGGAQPAGAPTHDEKHSRDHHSVRAQHPRAG